MTNLQLRRSKTPKPIIPGQDLVGEIEAVGSKVTRFKKSDQVIAWSGLRLGTYAEYACLPEKGVMFIKPTCMTYEEAATVSVAGLDSTYLLRKAEIRRGEKVLINGATFEVDGTERYWGFAINTEEPSSRDVLLEALGEYIEEGDVEPVFLTAFPTGANGQFIALRKADV